MSIAIAVGARPLQAWRLCRHMGRVVVVMLALTCVCHAVIIDHHDIAAVSSYPQGLRDAIGTQRWFFFHASVGTRIVMGLGGLHATQPALYQWRTNQVNWNGAAPGQTAPGTVYDGALGGPPWDLKLLSFTNTVIKNGWHAPKVDAVMQKLCYVDYAANLNAYLDHMAALEAFSPFTRVVYCTMPLRTESDSTNVVRNTYNRQLRAYCETYNKLLFDVADIEAHDTNGQQQFFIVDGVTNQRMWAAYTSDGGHPNELGRQQLALGWYAAGAQIAVPEAPARALAGLLTLFVQGIGRRFARDLKGQSGA